MLRRRLIAVLLCLMAAGLPVAAEAAFAALHADHASMQHDESNAPDCNDNGTTAGACGAHCAATACVVSSARPQEPTVRSVPPVARATVRMADGRAAPDTAPPRPSLADLAA